MENYEINSDTLAILPISKNMSRVIEGEYEFIVQKSPTEIIDHSCKYFGSSYKGRYVGSKYILGLNYKLPILIEETRDIIFFPTESTRVITCSWIAFKQIENMKQLDNISTITFRNGRELTIDISLGSLKNQFIRSTMLKEANIKRRKISKNKLKAYFLSNFMI